MVRKVSYLVFVFAILLSACSAHTPAPTPTVTPTATPIPLTQIDLQQALIQADDLSLGGTFPIEGWKQCEVDKAAESLARSSADVSVAKSAATSWVRGATCESKESADVIVTQYTWITENERYAARLRDNIEREMTFLDILKPFSSTGLKESRVGSTLMRTLQQDIYGIHGDTDAEVITSYQEGVIQFFITSSSHLVAQDYLDIAQAAVERLTKAQTR